MNKQISIKTLRDYQGYRITKSIADDYMESLMTHILYVREAGHQIGVPLSQILIHDRSKFDMEEFPYYARNFFGDKKDPVGFSQAWLHHIHNNPHHWNHWIINNQAPQEMPRHYALEMVADWMGAGKAYQNSWDMTDWLMQSKPTISLHPKTATYVDGILTSLGYRDLPAFNVIEG